MRITRVTIVNTKTIPEQNLNELLLLFGQSLGLFGQRDKDKSCYRIFIVLVKAMKVKLELTSDELAMQTGLSRGTVVHHLNTLMDAGIVTNYKNKYYIDFNSLEELVHQMKANVGQFFDNLEDMAKEIDTSL